MDHAGHTLAREPKRRADRSPLARLGRAAAVLFVVAGSVAVAPVAHAETAPRTSDAAAAAVPVPPPDASIADVTTYRQNAYHDARAVAPLSTNLADAWSVDLGARVVDALVVGDRVFVVTYPDGGTGTRLFALDRLTGATIWGPKIVTGSWYENGISADSKRIYSVNSEGVVRAYNQSNGSREWATSALGWTKGPPPIVRDGRVYVGLPDGVAALDAATKALVWRTTATDSYTTVPTLAGDALYIGDSCGNAVGVDAATGIRRWRRDTGCFSGGGQAAMFHDGHLFVRDSQAAVLDAETGDVVRTLPNSLRPPALADGVAYLANGHALVAQRADDGSGLWSHDAGDWIAGDPVVVGDLIAIATLGGTLQLIDRSTGASVWSDDLGSPVLTTEAHGTRLTGGIVASRDTLLVPATNRLVAYRDTRTATTTSLTAPAASTLGSPTAFTATVADGATGTVSFYAGEPAPIPGCAHVVLDGLAGATCTTTSLAEGTHRIEAQYEGDATRLPSISSAQHTVTDARTATSISLSAGPNPSFDPELVTVTATVTPSGGTGTVGFHVEDTAAPLPGCEAVSVQVDGTATCEAHLPIGERQLWATFGGTATYKPSTGSVAQDVRPPHEGGSIAGKVTTTSWSRVFVTLLDPTDLHQLAQVEADDHGNYAFDDLDPGSYLVSFGATHHTDASLTGDSDELSDGSHDLATATPVVVGLDPVSGVDATLDKRQPVNGKVMTGGVGVAGAVVHLSAHDGTATQDPDSWAITGNDGAFSLGPVDLGTYDLTIDRELDGIVDATKPDVVVGAGQATDVGTLTVSVLSGVPGLSTNVVATPDVGSLKLSHARPVAGGAPTFARVIQSADPERPTALVGYNQTSVTWHGVRNGLTRRIAITYGNAQGVGPGVVRDAAPTGCAGTWFLDLPADSPFCEEVNWVVDHGIANGYGGVEFRPTESVSREAFAAFLYRAAGSPDGPSPTCTDSPFSDVPAAHPFCGQITWLVESGIASGYPDGTFRGGVAVTRQAAASFLQRFVGETALACTTAPFSDVAVTHPFCGSVQWMYSTCVANGYPDGSFHPTDPVSRQAMAAFLFNVNEFHHEAIHVPDPDAMWSADRPVVGERSSPSTEPMVMTVPIAD